MGQHLSALSGPASLKYVVDVESAPPPTDAKILQVLQDLEQAVTEVLNYQPQPEPIRLVINNPNDPQLALDAASALSANISMIAQWHEVAEMTGKALETLTTRLSTSTLPHNSESAASLIRILSLVWRFDQGKLAQPGIQNDFAGYRRVLGKIPAEQAVMDETTTSMISMWVADMLPLSSKCVASLNMSMPVVVCPVLAAAANCCCGMANGPKSETPDTYLQAMVCAMIFFDKLQQNGNSVFTNRTVAAKKCITAIKNHGGASTAQLSNSLKFSTVTFREAPESVQRLLE